MDVFLLTACITAFLISTVLLLITYDVHAKRAHAKQSFHAAFRHYICVKAIGLLGAIFKNKLIRATHHVEQRQRSFLLDQLRQSAGTEYGRKYNFGSVSCVEEFKQTHPLTRYDHYIPYVNRMMEGEGNVLTKEQPDIFGVSSGTSGGGSKTIPMLRRQKRIFFFNAVSVLYCYLVEAYPETSKRLRKSLKIFYNPTWRTSKSGIKIGPNSSSPSTQKSILHMYSTPAAGFQILSEPEGLYVHLLFALKDRHLGTIEGNFASLVYNAMTTLQHSLQDLANDIQHGTLNAKLNIKYTIRTQLEKLLQPDPTRAEEIRSAFDEGIVGVCKRIWPELCVVLAVDTGAFAPYGDKLRETFCYGVPLYSPLYAATEGLIGINVWTDQLPSRYLPHPCVQFFEFIPVQSSHLEQPETLLLHQVQEGQEYEVVLTNVSGLYRYRLGDVVRVTGFQNQCPILEFLYRVGQFLDVRGEKTCESLFYEALSEAVARWSGIQLVDYCCAESILMDDVFGAADHSCAPCYHVFLEIEEAKDRTGTRLSENQQLMIDDCLCQKSYVYASFRKKGSIDVMKVHVLQPGAFGQLRALAISTTGASFNQFKVPRVLKNKAFVDFLCNKIV